ncbi:MAG: trypsin-like peptidase domain-containing protein [Ruminococcus sp.]|nr:trypsin-like peptidase domain-containing protein [Ruminococcus sp.]
MKKSFKSLVAALLAVCVSLLVVMPVPMSAEAVTWVCGDVNNDGSVSLTDVTSLNKYLSGKVELVDYTKADTNADCVINAIDALILNKYITRLITSLPYTAEGGGYASATTATTSINSDMGYTIFNASGAYVDEYTLVSNPVKDNSREIIGVDNRYSDNALLGVVKIFTDYQVGTGFFVDAHTIATAAHCLFDYQNGTFSNSKVQISSICVYDESGNRIKTIRSAYNVHIPNNYITKCKNDSTKNESYSYDYALITISEELGEYANFNLGIATDNVINSSLPVYTTGFPSDKTGKQTCAGNIMSFECPCDRDDEMDYTRNTVFDMDVMDGQSGSPVYTYMEYGGEKYYTVIGIAGHGHTDYLRDENGQIVYGENGLAIETATVNYGPRMTTELLHFYKNNPNIDWQGKSDE